MKLSKLVCGIVTVMALAIMVPGYSANLYASNIVSNGGFETGDFTNWSQFGATTFNGVPCPGPSLVVSEGNCGAFFGPIGTTGGISQVFSTIAGQAYQIDFDFKDDGGAPSSFAAIFDGNTLINLSNPSGGPFQHYSFLSTATTNSTTLSFSFRDDPGFLLLDAVRVEESAVPEPTSLLLLGSSLGGIALAFVKRAKNQI